MYKKSDGFLRIYKLTCSVNGKSYIGVTGRTLPARWQGHKDHAKEGRRKGALQNAIRKYGTESFSMEELYICVDAREAIAVERGLIASYGTLAPHGYNMTSGGEDEVGFTHSAETRKRLSANAKARGPHPNFISAARSGKGRIGIKRSPETLEKMRLARTGVPLLKLRGREFSEERRANISKAVKKAIAEGRLKPPRAPSTASDETRRKMSESQKRRDPSTKYIQPVKVTDIQVAEIRNLITTNAMSQSAIARQYGVSAGMISQIKLGQRRFGEKHAIH